MPIKNEKIGQNFRENTKIRKKSNKKLVWPAWKNEKLEKFFLCEKNFPENFGTNRFFRTRSSGYVIGPRLGWLARLTGLRT